MTNKKKRPRGRPKLKSSQRGTYQLSMFKYFKEKKNEKPKKPKK